MKKIIFPILVIVLVLWAWPAFPADVQVKDMTEETAPATTDILYVVKTPATTPLDRKVTIGNAVKAVVGALYDSEAEITAALGTKQNTVTEGSLTDEVIVSADIKQATILNADRAAALNTEGFCISIGNGTAAITGCLL